MSIKEIPTNFRVYYKSMMDTIRPKYEKEVERYEALIVEEKALYDEVKSIMDAIKANYNFDVMKYKEFVDNKYITMSKAFETKIIFENLLYLILLKNFLASFSFLSNNSK